MTTQDYNQCVDNYADAVFRFVLKNIRDEETAKDVVQDAFTKMWVKHKDVDAKKSKSYLFTAAYHTMIDYIRKDRKQEVDDGFLERNRTDTNSYSDLSEVLNDALETLPSIQKSVILLRDYEGYSYREIGNIVELNESQVKVYIYRARLALKKYIGSLEMVI
ncbi:MAG: RNA polymerase sigma factor [Bacteroidetes bacterium]|nr:MAG: RNA polymerase sigma factor [Bacteroidota bacterium]